MSNSKTLKIQLTFKELSIMFLSKCTKHPHMNNSLLKQLRVFNVTKKKSIPLIGILPTNKNFLPFHFICKRDIKNQHQREVNGNGIYLQNSTAKNGVITMHLKSILRKRSLNLITKNSYLMDSLILLIKMMMILRHLLKNLTLILELNMKDTKIISRNFLNLWLLLLTWPKKKEETSFI